MKLSDAIEQQVQAIRNRLDFLSIFTPESKEKEMVIVKNGIAALDEMIAAEKAGKEEW